MVCHVWAKVNVKEGLFFMQNFQILKFYLITNLLFKGNQDIFFLHSVTLVFLPFSPGSCEARPVQGIPQRTLWAAHQLPSQETLPPGLWDHVTGGRPVSSRDCLCAGKELALWPEFSQPSSLSSLPGTRVVKYAVLRVVGLQCWNQAAGWPFLLPPPFSPSLLLL